MTYVLVNRDNIVVDILHGYIRYIKLQSSNGITVACEESEGTGVIGSDCDTHYVLMRSDTTSSPDAVRVLAYEDDIPSEVVPGEYKLDTETNTFVYRYTLDEAKYLKQEQNKVMFAAYLNTHPLTWVDGKEYGVSEADQAEISLNINQYQIAVAAGVETPTLEWHARHEECRPWTMENLAALSLGISKVVYPKYHKMQQYKTSIYACESIEELKDIKISYEDAE